MTTYTLTGFSLLFSDLDGDGLDETVSVGATEIKFVVEDSTTSFSYSVLFSPEDPNELPIISLDGNSFYNINVNGFITDSSTAFTIGEIHWETDLTAQVFALRTPDQIDHLFHINGDELDISTPEDLIAFETAATFFGEVSEPGWQAGDTILLANLAGVTISKHDEITGTVIGDVYSTGDGQDSIYSGDGDDTIKAGGGSDLLDGGDGKDVLKGGKGNDTIEAGSGSDHIKGGIGNDIINAGKGFDFVKAGDGDDSIDGGTGSDTINGGQGDDTIIGGSGHDTLEGGDGFDVFVFTSGSASDLIDDFENDIDTIQLDSNLWTGTLSKNQLLAEFGEEVVDGDFDGVVLDFGGDVLHINGATIENVRNDLEII